MIFGYKFCYGGKRVHFKMIVADCLLKPLQIKSHSLWEASKQTINFLDVTFPILREAKKYAEQNLSRHRWCLCNDTFLKQFIHLITNDGELTFWKSLVWQSVSDRGSNTF